MALKKLVIDEKGIPTNYFRIGQVTINFINKAPSLEIYVMGYANNGFRQLEKGSDDKDYFTNIYTEFFYLPLDDSKGYSQADLYTRMKNELEFFEGAEDC